MPFPCYDYLRMKALILLSVAILVGAITPTPVWAAQDLLQFLQLYKDKFASEVTDDAPFSRSYTTRITIEPRHLDVDYDDKARQITVGLDQFTTFAYQEVEESCKRTGTGVGTTALGVTTSFVKQTCIRVFLKGNDERVLGDPLQEKSMKRPRAKSVVTLTGSPQEFRAIRDHGFDIEVTFVPRKGDGVVVEYDRGQSSPSLDYRFETDMHVYKLHATIKRVDYFKVGSKSPFRSDAIE
jgi:hypothetical protein